MSLILDDVGVRQYGEVWLADVGLELSRGMTVLIGPATAGKTTLMRVVAGLLPPTTGRVVVGGVDVTSVSVRKRSVAFVYQQFINYPSLTVYENIASPLRLAAGYPKQRIDARVHEVAELMGIAALLSRRPGELSGGQQQRTAIARALAYPVDVLLLDEPLANLDYKLREQLLADLRTMFRDADGVVLYSTADPTEALTLGASTVVLREGRVQHVGDVAAMYERPPTLAVAATLSDPPLNVLPGTVHNGRIDCLGTSFPGPPTHRAGQRVALGVRPHQVTIGRTGPDDLEFAAEVRIAEVTGSATFLHLLLPGPRHLVAELPGAQRFQPGESATAFVNPAHIFVFDEETGRPLSWPTSSPDVPAEVELHG